MAEDAGTGLPQYGIAADFQGHSDDDYVDSLFPSKKQPKQPVFTKITPQQVAEIEAALQEPTYTTEAGTEGHIREVFGSAATCPICHRYEHWNRFILKEHIRKHPEIVAYLKSQRNAENQYEQLQQKHQKLREQLSALRAQLVEVDRQLERFDSKSYEQDSRLAQKLARLLNPWG